jgi:hypothetical protein
VPQLWGADAHVRRNRQHPLVVVDAVVVPPLPPSEMLGGGRGDPVSDQDKVSLNCSVPLLLRDAVDAAAQVKGITRAAWVEQAVRAQLNGRSSQTVREPRVVESRLRER